MSLPVPAKPKYYSHHEIDKAKWDECIAHAGNGIIYASSGYLDSMSAGWDALVLNDYEAVMPLTHKRKYGISYLYQPYFIPALGVFTKDPNPEMVQLFIRNIPSKFRYCEISLNEANHSPGEAVREDSITWRNNYLLPIHQPYTEVRTGYKRLCHRMINKASASGIIVSSDGSPAEVTKFYSKHYKDQHPGITAKVYEDLIAATSRLYANAQVKVYLAHFPGGEMAAAYLVLRDKKFVYSLIGGSTEKGKQSGAFYLLTDAAIRDHAGENLVFRFEGSDIPGIAFFNSQFGAMPVKYPRITINNLPFPVNLFK